MLYTEIQSDEAMQMPTFLWGKTSRGEETESSWPARKLHQTSIDLIQKSFLSVELIPILAVFFERIAALSSVEPMFFFACSRMHNT